MNLESPIRFRHSYSYIGTFRKAFAIRLRQGEGDEGYDGTACSSSGQGYEDHEGVSDEDCGYEKSFKV